MMCNATEQDDELELFRCLVQQFQLTLMALRGYVGKGIVQDHQLPLL
jgi:hypothetical protein